MTLCMSYRRRVAPNATKTLPAVSSMQLLGHFTTDYQI